MLVSFKIIYTVVLATHQVEKTKTKKTGLVRLVHYELFQVIGRPQREERERQTY